MPESVLKNVFFLSTLSGYVQKLSGFKKGFHSVPKYKSSSTERFIDNISKDEVENHIEEVSSDLRKLFNLKSRDYELMIEGSTATFECPYFTYNYRVELNENDPSEVIYIAELYPIDLEKIFEYSEDFDRCFPTWFSDLIFTYNKNINIPKLIEQIEDNEESNINKNEIDYDSSKTFVSVYNKQFRRNFIIYDDRIEIKFQVKETVPKMIDGLKDISNELIGVSANYKLLE